MVEKRVRDRYQSLSLGGLMGTWIMRGRGFTGRLVIAAMLATAPGAAIGAPASSDSPRDTLPLAGGTVVNPDWVVRPTGEDLSEEYPVLARQFELRGTVRLQCQVAVDGTLGDCNVAQEKPLGMGFGEAALRATKHFRMRPMTVNGIPVAGASVIIPLTFNPLEPGTAPVPPTFAEPIDATSLALARDLVTAMDLKAHFISALQASPELLTGDQTPQQVQAVQSVKNAVSEQADAIGELAAKQLASTLPSETIKAIIAFYQSPAGKAWSAAEASNAKAMQPAYIYVYSLAMADAHADFCKKVDC